MSAPPLIVIFGAMVRPDGSPSPTLLRRIGGGLAAARAHAEAPVLCSGGVTAPGAPSEASVMGRVLAAQGISPDRLILDELSRTTADNAAAAARQAAAAGHPYVIACSDAYHLPRIRILLSLHGLASRPWPCGERPPFGHGLGMTLREGLAIPYNLALAMVRRARRAS